MNPVSGNVRSLAAWTFDRILKSRAPAGRPLQEAAKDLDDRDARLLRELVLGCLRWLRRLDSILEAASNRRLARVDDALLAPLRLGVYQLLYLDRIPAHAVVHEAVEEARRRAHRGGASFVNAVLRRVAGAADLESWPIDGEDPIRGLAIETSHPDLLVRRWWQRFGEQATRDILTANNRRKPRQILAFAGRGGRAKAAALLLGQGVVSEPSDVSPEGLVVSHGDPVSTRAFADGWIYLQDVASQAAALVPVPGKGERVLDMAAAPGGKSFSLLSFEPQARVVAADLDLRRLTLLKAHRERLELPLPLVAADGLLDPFASRFDRVLLDLPCTGTGTLRKNPELKWRFSEQEMLRLGRQGLQWLEVAAERVRPGGILAIVTCSLEPEENAGIVHRFQVEHPAFTLLPLEGRLPVSLDPWISGPGSWQILPEDIHDGFTVHVLRQAG